eukprot:CAMPEP_0178403628 /NCGR_PEP_ID=MMETSP0689_2-20121128/17467_1 /TAXON_ID=160604 /ORGANISM="Amphidinium massartii, Strain CS-259" /LENGTH=417 /DNA_ID=CAMNT_0020024589 /DNA_START=9 /DNA_END=1260 /DNA_ORIENTATION=+
MAAPASSRGSIYGEDETESQGTVQSSCGMLSLADMQERALKEIERRLRRNSARIFPVLEMVRHDDLAAVAGGGGRMRRGASSDLALADRPPFAKSYVRISQVPKEFLAEFYGNLTQHSMNDYLLLEKTSRGSLVLLMSLLLGYSPDCKWPKAAKPQQMFHDILLRSGEELGSLWNGLQLLKPTPGQVLVNWAQQGFYKIENGEVVHIHGERCNLGLTLPPDGSWSIVDNELEMQASLRFGPVNVQLCSLFPHKGRSFVSGRSNERFTSHLMSLQQAALNSQQPPAGLQPVQGAPPAAAPNGGLPVAGLGVVPPVPLFGSPSSSASSPQLQQLQQQMQQQPQQPLLQLAEQVQPVQPAPVGEIVAPPPPPPPQQDMIQPRALNFDSAGGGEGNVEEADAEMGNDEVNNDVDEPQSPAW